MQEEVGRDQLEETSSLIGYSFAKILGVSIFR